MFRTSARSTVEFIIALTFAAVLALSGCGAGGSNGPQPVCCAMPNITFSIVPYKGIYASGALVTIEDAYGSLISSTVNASGVADITMPAFPAYPLIVSVSVSGSYYNENTGALETSSIPLRGLIDSYETLAAASRVAVTAVTETAVADLLMRAGSAVSPSYPLQATSAVASLRLAGDMLGIPASAVPVFDAATHTTGDANTLRLSALAIAANGTFPGATLAHSVQALAANLAALNAASAPSEIITQAAYTAAFNAMTSGASSVMAASAVPPAAPVVSTSTQAVLYANTLASIQRTCSSAGYLASALSSKNTVCMMTSKGELVLELDATKAPVTVANFLQYVNEGFYSGTTFHRVISNFMIQGGGYTVSGNTYLPKAATHPPIALERTSVSGLSNTRGTIAMARTNQPDTATSQFFINVVDNPFLNVSGTDPNGYAVFGNVISGMDVVDQIKAVPVVSNGSEISLPASPVYIEWAYQIK